jgi:hypothetical protein
MAKTTLKTPAINALVKKLCKQDGGKKQLNAGQARRVLKSFFILIVKDPEFKTLLEAANNEVVAELAVAYVKKMKNGKV